MLILQHIKIKYFLQEDRMSMCPICTILKEEREKTNDRNIMEFLDNLYDEHNKLQM